MTQVVPMDSFFSKPRGGITWNTRNDAEGQALYQAMVNETPLYITFMANTFEVMVVRFVLDAVSGWTFDMEVVSTSAAEPETPDTSWVYKVR